MYTISKYHLQGVTVCYWEGLEQKKINLLLAEREKWKMVLEKKFTYNWSGPIFEKSILGQEGIKINFKNFLISPGFRIYGLTPSAQFWENLNK